MQHRVGRITLAVALIAVGAVLVYDNVLGTDVAEWLFRLWPALLILLGLEWVVAAALTDRRVQTDAGAIALLLVGAVLMATLGTAYRTFGSWEWMVDAPRVIGFSHRSVSPSVTTSYEPVSAQVKRVEIESGSAAVQVRSGDRLSFDLQVSAHGRTPEEAEQDARRVTLEIETGETTQVRVAIPSGVNLQTLLIRATLPPGIELAVESGSGAVMVQGLSAPVTVRASSGAVRVDQIDGDVHLQTSSGAIMASEITGDAKAVSSSGAIRIDRVDGNLDASSSSGSINLMGVTGQISAQASSGAVTVVSDVVGGPYDLGAISGSIRLTVPASASISVDARSSSGSIAGPSWLRLGEGRGSGSGTQGDGIHQIILRTTSGSILLSSR